MVPSDYIDAVQEALQAALAKTVVGDPQVDGVRMGALVGLDQREDVRAQVAQLREEAELVYGSPDSVNTNGADSEKGAFMSPMLLRVDNPSDAVKVHEVEAFGPVSSIMPYDSIEQAVELSKKGKGSLCCSITTHDKKAASEFVRNAASMHGRILVLD